MSDPSEWNSLSLKWREGPCRRGNAQARQSWRAGTSAVSTTPFHMFGVFLFDSQFHFSSIIQAVICIHPGHHLDARLNFVILLLVYAQRDKLTRAADTRNLPSCRVFYFAEAFFAWQ